MSIDPITAGENAALVRTKLNAALFYLNNLPSVSLKDFGAVGDNTADDSDAIEEALVWADLNNAVVTVPPGTYRITREIAITSLGGNRSFQMIGASNNLSGGVGCEFVWDGGVTTTQSMFKFLGLSNCVFENMGFAGAGKVKDLMVFEFNYEDTTGSYLNVFRHCVWGGAAGTDSACLRLGLANYQVSEFSFYDCMFRGYQTNPPLCDYGVVTSGSNAKDFYFIGGSAAFFRTAAIKYAGSGVFTCQNMSVGYNALDFHLGAGRSVLTGVECEGSTKFIHNEGGPNNQSTVTVIGCSFTSELGSDDLAIHATSNLTMIGCDFINERVLGSTTPLINISSNDGRASIVSLGNYFSNCVEYPPFRLSGQLSDSPFEGVSNGGVMQASIFSRGDMGGPQGAVTALKSVELRETEYYNTKLMRPGYNHPSTASYTLGALRRSVNKVTLPYSLLVAAATTKDYRLFSLDTADPYKWRIVGAYINVKTAFAGITTVTAQLGLGWDNGIADADAYLLDHDIKTAGGIGYLEADLGVQLQKANLVQGAEPSRAGNNNIWIRFTGSGNFGNGTVTNLSAGSLDVVVVVERLD